ncbi:MAG: aminoacyl-tRNA hydrolase [Candidatus Omnitrophica bacterium]|nr:aminoacyl-tRNA hydrolase [Candidatus Omnitrophota bacterium]
MKPTKLIIGLGNPGKNYTFTRHNLGFLVVERFAQQLGLKFQLSSFTNGVTAQGAWEEHAIGLLLPLTYMNRSGMAVRQAMEHLDIAAENILVVTDDFQIPFQQMRLKSKGSDGGHNGLASIIEHLNTQVFPRLRVGIGDGKKRNEWVDFVLGEFTSREKKDLEDLTSAAVDCCKIWINEGINKAMEKYNRRNEHGKE